MPNEEKLRVLVVDDEESLLAVLTQVLRRNGYDVTAAASGEEAWEIFQNNPFSLVITDIVMKKMSGIDLLKKIKEISPETQVIIITSYASLDTVVTALRSGAYDYLLKPFEDLEVIKAVTTRAVEKIKLISENKQLVENLNEEIAEHKRTAQELKRAKELADSSNRAKSEFLANMSHEFRTPLSHIIGFTEILINKKYGDYNKDQEKYLNYVLSSSQHLLKLLNDILDLSKVENGKMEFNPSQINLKILIENSMNMFKEKATEHNIVLSSDIDNAPETINADERKLQQIIYNLLSNAVKFTPDNGRVSLAARKVVCKIRKRLKQADAQSLNNSEELAKDSSEIKNNRVNCVEISVNDTGIGIQSENLKRVFNRFEQIDGSVNRKHKGTGLGLSLTSALVKLHGGKIWAESKGKDRGSNFRFIIPV